MEHARPGGFPLNGLCSVFGVLSLVLVATIAKGEGPPRGSLLERVTARIEPTQLKISLDRGRQRTEFRATVIAKRGGDLTLLTAGHCLGADDANQVVRIHRKGEALNGMVVGVVRNPVFRPPPTTDIPGADNALAVVRLDLNEPKVAAFVGDLQIADLTDAQIPGPAGRVVTVVMIDQFGKEHVVKGGNFSNPRWLEWGPAFRPVGGDSGSGVFVVRRTAEGDPQPVLVGVVVDRSEQGGGASLVDRKSRWVGQALAERGPTPRPVREPGPLPLERSSDRPGSANPTLNSD